MEERFELIEDYELEPVPQSKRKGWGRLSFVWMGGIVALSAIVLGGTLGAGLPLSEAVLASLVGSFILAVLSAASCVVGAKTGLSTSLVSRFALGKYGSYAVSVIVALSLFGWFGVQLDLFGSSLRNVLIDGLNIHVPSFVLVIIGGILMTTTAFIGYKAIEKLSLVAVPLLALLLVASLARVMKGQSFQAVSDTPLTGDSLTFGSAVSLIIGSLAVGVIIGPDISRYARSTKDAIVSSFVGYFGGLSVVLVIAAILAKATSKTDIVNIMLDLGWGSAALIILILAQWTTNDNNLYSSALGFSAIFPKVPKSILTISAGAIGTIMALTGIYDNFIPFLNFLSAFIPPVGGVFIADFIINRGKYQFANLEKIKRTEPVHLIIWLIAVLVAFMTTEVPSGFGWFTITGASGFDAFLVAFILQMIVSKFMKSTRHNEIKHSDTEGGQAL